MRRPRFSDNATWDAYTPNPRQQLFHRVPYWEGMSRVMKGAVGGLGGGKSTACINELIETAMRCPRGVSIVCRQTMTRADISLIDEVGKFLGPAGKWVVSRSSYYLPNEHRIICTPADMWDRHGSTEYVAGFVQEAQEVKWKIVSTIFERLRHPAGIVNGKPMYRLLFDARGVESSHWVAKDFIANAWNIESGSGARTKVKKPWYAYLKFKTSDNREHLESNYESDLRRDHAEDPVWIKVMLEGEIGYSLEGEPAFGDYDPEMHDADIEYDPGLPILRGWDFGYLSPAVVWCQQSRDGRLCVLRELVPSKCSRESLVDQVLEYQRQEFAGHHSTAYRDFGDIAGEQGDTTGITDVEFVSDKLNIGFENLIKDNDRSREWGLEVIRSLMRKMAPGKIAGRMRPKFLVDRRCTILREALRGGYYYEEGTKSKTLTKNHPYSDVVDALRYVASSIIPQEGETYDGHGQGFRTSRSFAAFPDAN